MAGSEARDRGASAGRIPLVTLLLILANIGAAFALYVYPEYAFQLGFRPNNPRIDSALTSLFLHANVFHLLGNMVFLAAVGAAVELATGSFRFATVYFLAGLTGVAVHYLATRGQMDPAPLIGASGCIAGCAAYYSVRYTSLKVPIAPHVALSVAGVTAIWLVLQVAGAFIHFGDGGGGASFWAHLGGFGAGVVLSFVFRAPDLGQIKLGHEVLEQMNLRGPGAVLAAAQRHLALHPRDVKVLWDLAEAQRQLGEREEEAVALMRILELVPEDEQVEVLRRLCQAGRVTKISTIRRLQYADQVRVGAPAVAKALLRSVVDGPKDEAQRPDAILALAAIERDDNPERATQLLAELTDKYPLHPAVDLARKRGWVA